MPNKPTIVLTRPASRQQGLFEVLTGYGLTVLALPALSIEPLILPNQVLGKVLKGVDPNTSHPFLAAPVKAPLANDSSEIANSYFKPYDLIVFVSRAAVECFPHHLCADTSNTMMASVGSQTAQAIRQRFGAETIVLCPLDAAQLDSEALWQVLMPYLASVDRVLIVRAENGRDWLRDQFVTNGCQVDYLAVYTRKPCVWSAEQVQNLNAALDSQTPLIWLLTSVESVEAVEAQFNRLGVQAARVVQGVVVTHPRVLDRVRRFLATTISDDLSAQKMRDVTPCQMVASSEPEVLQGLLKLFKFMQC